MLRGIVQHDTLNVVNIRLSDGSKAFDYYGYTNIVLKVLKADGTSYIDSEGENVVATSPEDGIVTVILGGQATAAAGLNQAVIEIYADGDRMTSARLIYEVFEELPVDETALVSEDVNVTVVDFSASTEKAKKIGHYMCNVDTPDGHWWYVNTVANYSGAVIVQEAYNYSHNRKCRRFFVEGTWGEWEYVNPPMELDTEYRTTERYLGKPVYTKIVDFGLNTNGKTMVVAYDVQYVVRCEAQGGGSLTYPCLRFQDNTEWNCAFFAICQKVTDHTDENYGKNSCVVHCSSGTSASDSYSANFVRVWYTKTTDT